MIVRFTAQDAAEITHEDGSVVTCYRANMGPGHGWRAVWIDRGRPTERPISPTREVTDEELQAIRKAERAPVRILLLEDNQDLADSILAAFELRGYDVVHVRTVEAARDAYEVDGFNVLLCDYDLPDGTAFDFLGGVRGSDKATTILWSGLDRKKELDASGQHVDYLLLKDDSRAVFDAIEEATSA